MRSVGCFLVTCVNLPSGAKCCARKAFALLLVFSLCLTVPVFANDIQAVLLHDGAFGYLAHNGDLTTPAFQPFNNMSATISYSSDSLITPMPGYTILSILGDVLNTGSSDLVAVYPNDIYFEVIFPVGQGDLTISNSNISTAMNYFYPPVISPCDADGNLSGAAPLTNYVVELLIDDVVHASQTISGNPGGYPDSFNYSGPVNTRFSLRYHVHNPDASSITINFNGANYFRSELDIPYDIFTFNGQSVDVDNIEVVIGKLDYISGKLDTIESATINIDNNLSEINNGLKDSNSSIWQAAGSAISNAVTGLFVPDQAELSAKVAEVENIVKNKLGDSYEVIERVEQYENELVGSFTGGGRQYHFNFPGISVPLPGQTVSILPEQSVTIENKAFNVFRDLLGSGVALLCALSGLHIAHDFVICILSGVSYWGFVRGRHDT